MTTMNTTATNDKMNTNTYISSLSINHNDQDGVRIVLHLEHTDRGYIWCDEDGNDVQQPASPTVAAAESLACHVWGADVWGLELHGGTESDLQATTTRPTMDELREAATKVETTSEWNGYPSHLRVMYTADTMADLRELHDAAVAEGHEANVYILHRQDGWSFWHRQTAGSVHDLDDDRWMSRNESDWTVDINADSDRMAEAFRAVCGEGYQVQDAADLIAKAEAVRGLAEDLTDPDILEPGQIERHWLDVTDGYRVLYRVRTGDTGYYYDTHHYCVAVMIIEREEDDERED